MERLPVDPRLPTPDPGPSRPFDVALRRYLTEAFREIAEQVNSLSEGQQAANYNMHSAVPTTGVFAIGDFIKEESAVERGTASSKYVRTGWICVSEGSASAASFVEARIRTDN